MGQPNVQSQLTPQLVTRLYAAEKSRLDWYEDLGIDGNSVGRGQLGQIEYGEVQKQQHFKSALENFMGWFHLSKTLSNPALRARGFDMTSYKVVVPQNYSSVWRNPFFEDFVVAAYLAIKIASATKSGRSSKDAARFGVALYHGKRSVIVAAQNAVNNLIDWAPVEAELLSKGYTDWVAYVNEIVK